MASSTAAVDPRCRLSVTLGGEHIELLTGTEVATTLASPPNSADGTPAHVAAEAAATAARADKYSFAYTGRHDHGDLPKPSVSNNVQLQGLLEFVLMAKQKTDETLTARIEAAKAQAKAQTQASGADATTLPPPSKKPRED